MKKKAKLFTAAAATATAAVAAYYAVGAVFYNLVLSKKAIDKAAVKSHIDDETLESINEPSEMYDGMKWFRAVEKERPCIELDDGEKLYADFIADRGDSHKWFLCCHGYTASPEAVSPYGKRFFEMGFNVLLPSLRGHYHSECDYVAMGWKDRLDILKWIDWIIRRDEDAQIVLFGVSMGAATVMMTTGEELPANIVCAIEDCGYTSVWEEFSTQIRERYSLPPFPFLNAASSFTKLRAGYEFKEASAIEQLKKSVTPTLFIHGDDDKFVPFWMLDKVYDAASCEKDKLVITGATHANSAFTEPEIYWNKVKEFIGKYVRD